MSKKRNYIGSITKLSGKRSNPYWVRTPPVEVIPNVYKRVSLGTYKSKREAQEILANWQEEYERKTEKVYTLLEVYDLAIEELKNIGKTSQKTLDSYQYDFNRLKPLWDIDFKKISTTDYQNVFNNMVSIKTGAPLSLASKKRSKNILSIIYWYLKKENLTSYDASDGIIIHSEIGPKEIISFTNEDLKKLWDNLYKINYVDMILFLCYTGLRPSEFINCTTENTSTFKRSIENIGIKSEKGKSRIVPIPQKILPLVQHLIDKAKPGKYLFKTPYGNLMSPDNFAGKYFPEALEKCDINSKNYVPYSCRHTYASLLEKTNIDRKLQSDLMGHESISTTKIYQAPQLDVLLSAVDVL